MLLRTLLSLMQSIFWIFTAKRMPPSSAFIIHFVSLVSNLSPLHDHKLSVDDCGKQGMVA